MGELIVLPPGGGMITRHVVVDRYRPPMEILCITGRLLFVDYDVSEAMPRGDGNEVDVFFFKLNRYTSDSALEREYELHKLVPADPYSLIAVNAVDPTFADGYPNCTHWKDDEGRWCYAAFRRWYGDRSVHIRRIRKGEDDWHDFWWHAGLRK